MTTSKFESVLEAGGLSSPESLERQDDLELWRVRSPNAFGGTVLHVLHLKSNASLATATRARKAVGRRSDCYAVCENSCHAILRDPGAAQSFGVREVVSRHQFLLRAIRQAQPTITAEPIADSKAYIEPRVLNNGTDHAALGRLSNWLSSPRQASENGIGVLLADGGMGKTTLSRRLFRDLLTTKGDRFLVMKLESDDWRSVSADFSLWDVLLSAATKQQLPISLQSTFRTCVQEHLLLLVLDGFDELCSTSRGPSVESGVQQLLEIVGPHGRILITSRKGYWESNVSPETRDLCDDFELLAFDKQELSRYFERRFPQDFAARERARSAASKLRLQLYGAERHPPVSDRPTAVPAIAEMLCDAVGDDDRVVVGDTNAVSNPLWLVLAAQCRRERVRHQLTATEDEQLRLFMSLALWSNENFEAGDIQVYAELAAPDAFSDPAQHKKLLAPHSLIERAHDGTYRFRFAFLREYLQAELLARYWREANWSRLLELLKEDRHARRDSALIDFLAQSLDDSPDWRAVVDAARRSATGEQPQVVLGGLWHLAAAKTDRQDTSKSERRELLLRLFGSTERPTEVRGVAFAGPLFGLDLRGVVFSNCRFVECSFTNCEFDGTSQFERCSFLGSLRFVNCDGVKAVRLSTDGCHFSPESRQVWAELTSRSTLVDEATVQDMLHDALKRFLRHGMFRPQEAEHLKRGAVGASSLKRLVWDELEHQGILGTHSIPGLGTNAGRHIVEAAREDVRKFLESGSCVGRVGRTVRGILDRVGT